MDNSKKKILLIAAGFTVVLVAIIVVLYVVFANNKKVDHNADASYGSDFVSIDKKGTLNTDKVATKEQVTSAVGGNGTSISGPETTGVLRLGKQYSQTATYTFTMKNNKKATIDVDARTYPSKEDMEATGPFKNTELEKIEGIGDEAHWLIPTPAPLQVVEPHETLKVTKGLTSFAFALSQPRDNEVIDQATARDIILQIAKQAKLDAVK